MHIYYLLCVLANVIFILKVAILSTKNKTSFRKSENNALQVVMLCLRGLN